MMLFLPPLSWSVLTDVSHRLFAEKSKERYNSYGNTESSVGGCLPKNDVSGDFLKTRRFLLPLLLCLPLLSYTAEISARNTDDRGLVVYADSAGDALRAKSPNRPAITRSAESAQGQIFSRRKKMVATYDDNYFMTEGVKHCLKIAMNTWEERLDIKVPVKFFVCISEDLEPDMEMATTVGYVRKSQRESLPDNLYNQTSDTERIVHDTIKINAVVDWDFSWSYDDTYTGSVNLSRAFLRHIAHILGFGCSVMKRNGGMETAIYRTLSPFDRLLTNGQYFLPDIDYMNTSELEDFFSKPLRLKSSSFDYEMCRTEGYVPLRSGNYFLLGHDNIMEYPQKDDARLLPINRETLDVMAVIGWNVAPYDVEITGTGTDVLGYGSIYGDMHFAAYKAAMQDVAGQTVWRYQTYNEAKDSYEDIITCSGTTFTIVPEPSIGLLDEFGCLQARVVCRVSGTDYTLPLSLETRPLIGNVTVSNVSFPDSWHYRFDLSVEHKGATGGTVLVSDDTGVVLKYDFTGDVIQVGPLVKGYKTYIDISLSNAYGTAGKFIQGEPYITSGADTDRNSPMGLEVRVNGATGIEIRSGHPVDALVYDMSGRLVACAQAVTHRIVELQTGCYVLMLRDREGNRTMTEKIQLK